MDNSDTYRVGYLGCATINQSATGLGTLQKPLKDMYITHRRPGNPTSLPERFLTVTPDGLLMVSFDDRTGSQNEEFYPIGGVVSWDSVRFVVVKNTDKKDKGKIKCAFEPLDNDHSKVKDNLFTSLDKKFHYVHEQRHPPMFVCLLRRKSGVKLLDAHAFVCVSEDEALGLVQALNQVNDEFTSRQCHKSGVFVKDRNSKSSIRVTGGSAVVKIASSPANKLSSQDAPSVRNKTDNRSRSTPITNNIDGSASRSSDRGTDRKLGNQAQFFHLSQEDLVGPKKLSLAPSSKSLQDDFNYVNERGDGYQYLPNVVPSLERDKCIAKDFGSYLNNLDRQSSGSGSDNVSENSTPNNRSLEHNSGSRSHYNDVKPFNYALGYINDKTSKEKVINTQNEQELGQRSGDLGLKMGQGYSLLSGPNEGPKRHYSETGHGASTSPSPRRREITSVSGRPGEEANRQMFKELMHFQQRQQSTAVAADKVAAVCPAQLRPPKSPGYLDKPPGATITETSRQSQVQAQTATPVVNAERTQLPNDNVKSKPVARVPPHMVTGVRVLPSDSGSVQLRNPSPNKAERPKSGLFLKSPTSPESLASPEVNSPKRPFSQYDLAKEFGKDLKNPNLKQGNWQFSPTHQAESKLASRNDSLRMRMQHDKELENSIDSKIREQLLSRQKKDAEIAIVLENIKLDYKNSSTTTLTPGAPGGQNFEKSLGYFP